MIIYKKAIALIFFPLLLNAMEIATTSAAPRIFALTGALLMRKEGATKVEAQQETYYSYHNGILTKDDLNSTSVHTCHCKYNPTQPFTMQVFTNPYPNIFMMYSVYLALEAIEKNTAWLDIQRATFEHNDATKKQMWLGREYGNHNIQIGSTKICPLIGKFDLEITLKELTALPVQQNNQK